jgi:DNA-binding response OmpR family regulator
MKNNIKILLVEDDSNLSTILSEYLSIKGFEVKQAFNGEEGLCAFNSAKFDICLIDIMMPKMDGFTLAKKIHSINKNIPFLFLTAKSMLEDKLEAFKIGADDYITKPFSTEELIFRIKAILNRTGIYLQKDDKSEYSIGAYHFSFSRRILVYKDFQQKLTQRESELLRMLCQHENELLERSATLTKIWRDDSYFNSRSMDVYITKLRRYLKLDQSIELQNIHGIGYKLITK